jgi:hypothetical protein
VGEVRGSEKVGIEKLVMKEVLKWV